VNWVPVGDSLPAFGQPVLFCGAGPTVVAAPPKLARVVFGSRQPYSTTQADSPWTWVTDGYHYSREQVTHWMSLPEMPVV
jgi:hypothetical protein